MLFIIYIAFFESVLTVIALSSAEVGSLTASCWLSHRFEYKRESAGEERKEPEAIKVSKLTGLSPHVI